MGNGQVIPFIGTGIPCLRQRRAVRGNRKTRFNHLRRRKWNFQSSESHQLFRYFRVACIGSMDGFDIGEKMAGYKAAKAQAEGRK